MELHDAGVGDAGEDPDLVEGVVFFFLVEFFDVDLLHGVELGVFEALDLVDLGVGALPETLQNFEIFESHLHKLI